MKLNHYAIAALFAASALSGSVRAATLLDTGTPNGSLYPLVLDSMNSSATEFHLNSNFTINSVSGYLSARDTGASGDTFTIALYSDNNNHVGTQLQSAQATYSVDGWNGVSALNWNAGPGNYWVAFEVRASDSTAGLFLPIIAPNPALATAFDSGSGYSVSGGTDYGVRITGTPAVPVPAAAWLFMSSLGFVGGAARMRRSQQN